MLCISCIMSMRVCQLVVWVMAVDFQEATSSSLDPAMMDGKFMKSVQGGGTPSAPHLELGHAAHVGDMLPPSRPLSDRQSIPPPSSRSSKEMRPGENSR